MKHRIPARRGRRDPRRAVQRAASLFVLSLATLHQAGHAAGPHPAGADHDAAKPARAEALLLDVTVNGQRLKAVVHAELAGDGRLLLPQDAWQEARLQPTRLVAMSDGRPGHAAEDIAGASYRIDRQSLSLILDVPATALLGSRLLQTGGGLPTPSEPTRPGVMLDYDLSFTRAFGTTSAGAALEALAFTRHGWLVSSALVSDRTTQRLDTYWRTDLPQRMESVVIGDTVSSAGGWSRPVRYAGVRWGRDFGMQPGFVTMPQLTLSGQAALPSTVDVLVNNARRISQPVQPGPFDLANVPISTGAGEIGLVVRDLLGRETLVRQSYYASPRLLAPGLSDFSLEAGVLRSGYGSNARYGSGFAAGTWRQGLTPRLTGELRAEVQQDRRAAGIELSGVLGNLAAGRLALAGSTGRSGALSHDGALLIAGIERRTPSVGGSLQIEHATRGFSPFGEGATLLAAPHRLRDRLLASVGGPIWRSISGGASFVHQTRWNGDRLQLLNLSGSAPVWGRNRLHATFNKRLDTGGGWQLGLMLSVPLDAGVMGSVRVGHDPQRGASAHLAASRNAPAGPGFGWRAQASSTDRQRAELGLHLISDNVETAIDLAASADGVAARAGARGTLGWLDGVAFASRPVGHTSVAVVKVDGIEGIPVRRSNQIVAHTDSRGLAFIPGLLPWQQNKIEIDPVDLPLDVEVDAPLRQVVPHARSGVVVDFAARRSRQALLVLTQSDGAPVPVGTRVTLAPDGPVFAAGRRGEVWLTGMTSDVQRIDVSWAAGRCALDLKLPASGGDGEPARVGPLICNPETP